MESMSRKRVPKPQVIRHHWPNAPLDLPFLIHPFFPASVMKSPPFLAPTSDTHPSRGTLSSAIEVFHMWAPRACGPWALGSWVRQTRVERESWPGWLCSISHWLPINWNCKCNTVEYIENFCEIFISRSGIAGGDNNVSPELTAPQS